MLAVERMRRPAAALGPNWLALMTGRAQGGRGGRVVTGHPGLWREVQPS